MPAFNDDIEATGAVVLAALLGAERIPNVRPLQQQTFLFFGAGQVRCGAQTPTWPTRRAHPRTKPPP